MLSRRKFSNSVMVVKTGAGYLESILLLKEDRSGLQMNNLNLKLVIPWNNKSKQNFLFLKVVCIPTKINLVFSYQGKLNQLIVRILFLQRLLFKFKNTYYHHSNLFCILIPLY